ncbi:uncharacterized protein METZ01_LOCUS488369, partial [marine metagenome]
MLFDLALRPNDYPSTMDAPRPWSLRSLTLGLSRVFQKPQF